MIIEADIEAAVARFDAILERVEQFPGAMQQEFVAWQLQDMNRERPTVETPDRHTVASTFWPRGRRRIRPRGRLTARQASSRRRVLVSARPVLRLELHGMLADRMRGLMQAKLTWR